MCRHGICVVFAALVGLVLTTTLIDAAPPEQSPNAGDCANPDWWRTVPSNKRDDLRNLCINLILARGPTPPPPALTIAPPPPPLLMLPPGQLAIVNDGAR